MKPLILHIGSDRSLLQRHLNSLLSRFNLKATSPEKAVFALLEGNFDWVVICSSVHGTQTASLLKFIRRIDEHVPVVVIGEYAGEAIPGLKVAGDSMSSLLACLAGQPRMVETTPLTKVAIAS